MILLRDRVCSKNVSMLTTYTRIRDIQHQLAIILKRRYCAAYSVGYKTFEKIKK